MSEMHNVEEIGTWDRSDLVEATRRAVQEGDFARAIGLVALYEGKKSEKTAFSLDPRGFNEGENASSPEEQERNIFYDYFEQKVLPYVARINPDLVGFSIFLEDQFLPTLLLSRMIKERDPNTKVVGGAIFFLVWKERLPEMIL